jgi:hypothetical protein
MQMEQDMVVRISERWRRVGPSGVSIYAESRDDKNQKQCKEKEHYEYFCPVTLLLIYLYLGFLA